MLLLGHRTGYDRTLRGMEPGYYAAGDGHEKTREKRVPVLEVREMGAIREDCRIGNPRPDKGGEDRNRTDDEQRPEKRIYAADYLVHGEQGGGDVVDEDYGDRPPEEGDGGKDGLVYQVCRNIDEHRHDQQEQNRHHP